ncbi:hypothetical protein AB0M36_07135 [Actinoplanes sp. NPDC051346]|uniref:hypothetical protein n=1 Tax=Actinoplanes sp. NPDC051346 TaxID=3155048 RepID=UPI003430119F
MKVERKPMWTAGLAAALLIGFVVPVGAVSAHNGHAADDEGPVERVDQRTAVEHDVALVAARTGWAPAATAEHLRVQQRLGALLGRFAERHPGTFAGGRLAGQPGGASDIRFKGQVPADAAADAAAAGIRVDLTGGARYSSTELRARADAVIKHLRGLGYADATAAVRFDGTIDLTIGGGAPAPVLPVELREGVRVTTVPAAVTRQEHTRGGAELLDNNVFECTSGFTVIDNATGTTGVSTAGHCTGLDEYRPPDGDPDYGVTFQREHQGVYGDFQWMTTQNHVDLPEFYATSSEVRTLTAMTPYYNLATGFWSCVYGRGSNLRACDQVYSTYVVTVTVGSLVAMTTDHTTGGDSGGTWAFGTEGIGVHLGDYYTGGSWRNVYSLATNMYTALGVTVIL